MSSLILLVLCLGLSLWALLESLRRRSTDKRVAAEFDALQGPLELLRRQVKALKEDVEALKAGILLAGEEPTQGGGATRRTPGS